MFKADLIRTLQEHAEQHEDAIDAITFRLSRHEELVESVRAACAGNWCGEPTHRMTLIIEALEVFDGKRK